MRNSASFWAAKSDAKSLKASVTSDSEQKKPRTRRTKLESVLRGDNLDSHTAAAADSPKGTTRGPKKIDWADSDDDEEFLASFDSTMRIQELEKTIIANDVRIANLTTVLNEKNDRIVHLEGIVAEVKRGNTQMKGSMDALAVEVEELKQASHEQPIHVIDLVDKLNERQRRTGALETETNDHHTAIEQTQIEDGSTQGSFQDGCAISISREEPTPPAGVEFEKKDDMTLDDEQAIAEKEEVPVKPKENAEATKEYRITRPDQNSDTEAAIALPTQYPKPECNTKISTPVATFGPSPSLSDFPVFATPTTIKQTAPPPPAPKLKMGIDVSKFGKNSLPKKPLYAKTTVVASRKIPKDGPAPRIDPASDIRTKHHDERVLFGNGPHIQVRMGDVHIATIPKYVLMQVSWKAFEHFTREPNSTLFMVPANSMDVEAAVAHLQWMLVMTFQHRVYSVNLRSDEKFDMMNLQICRAARVLGLDNMYVGHFTRNFCNRIRSNEASYDLMSKVAELVYAENDPIYDCLANTLANFGLRKAEEESVEIEDLLKRYPHLKARVRKIQERMHKKPDGMKETKGQSTTLVDKKMDV